MKTTRVLWVVFALSCGALTYFATCMTLNRSWRTFLRIGPVIEYPVKLNLGEHEKGEVVVTPFIIANRGSSDLLIDEVSSNCGCTGMEQEQDGRYKRIGSLRLKSGEEAHLVMRVAVGGPLGMTAHNVVEFHTNDPAHPTARIEAEVTRVTGGIFTSPETVVFGTVPVGGKVHRIVEVRDPSLPPRIIKRVTSIGSDQISVKLLPVSEAPNPTEANSTRSLVGKLEVNLEGNHPRSINAAIHIEIAGREGKPDVLPVVGKVAALFEMSPSMISLPRNSSNGPLYTAECTCRSITGKPTQLAVESLPTGVTAQMLPQTVAGESVVQIAWDPKAYKQPLIDQRQSIRLRVKDGENESVLDLPIILRK